jgi:hypothetical protein
LFSMRLPVAHLARQETGRRGQIVFFSIAKVRPVLMSYVGILIRDNKHDSARRQ